MEHSLGNRIVRPVIARVRIIVAEVAVHEAVVEMEDVAIINPYLKS